MKRLVLIDGNALLHRAYHATPPLSTSKGELVNAVYGFTTMLLKALEDLAPDYLAVAWDMKGPTFRHLQYEQYKATRAPSDNALDAQYDRVFQIVDAFNIPEFKLSGFEADDLIGTLTKQAIKKEKSLEIIIITGDRDIMQLIERRVKVLMPKKTLTDVGLYGEEEFAARYGFQPEHLVDFKALAGDASDNIPGVSGIGEVTATKLIQQYKSVERLYKHLNDLPERMRQLLDEGRGDALMSKKLSTIETEIPIKLDLVACRVRDFQKDKVRKILEELEFKSLMTRIPGISEGKVESVTTDLDHQVEKVLEKMSKVGVLIDLKYLSELGKNLKGKISNLEQQIYSYIGHQINLNSPKQLSEVLFDELKLPIIRKTKTGRSTDEATLLELSSAHPAIPMVLQYRQLFKLVSTYIDALPKYVASDGRIHSKFNVEGALTGRLSSENPNLQNIPIRGALGSEVRKAFIVHKGKVLLGADYSQIELRILAHLSGDLNLIKAFQDGLDIHAATASKIFKVPTDTVSKEQRNVGKTMNFATLYGQGPHALSRQLGVDFPTAREYIEEYFDQFPKVKQWMQKVLEEARERGYVETIWGRRRYFPELKSSNRMFVASGERAAINHPIQGSSADMIKKAMVKIGKEVQSSKFKVTSESALVGAMVRRYKKGYENHRSVSRKVVETVLDIVRANPAYSVHKIYAQIPKVAGRVIVGHHGIQNILSRENLSTFAKRLIFAGGFAPEPRVQVAPLYRPQIPVYRFGMLLALFKMLPRAVIKSPRNGLARLGLTIIPFVVVGLWMRMLIGTSGVSPVGLLFASFALFFGLFFFIYSLKYYVSILMVLKLAQGGASAKS